MASHNYELEPNGSLKKCGMPNLWHGKFWPQTKQALICLKKSKLSIFYTETSKFFKLVNLLLYIYKCVKGSPYIYSSRGSKSYEINYEKEKTLHHLIL